MTGAAGEHLVMSRLLSRGYVAALAPQGAPNLDIVVTDPSGRRLASIQVKTRWEKGADGGWHMSKKHETISHPRMFYTFVDLGRPDDDVAKVFVVPSSLVAKVVAISHASWLSSPGRNGHVRKDTTMRRFRPDYSWVDDLKSEFSQGWLSGYLEKWSLLDGEIETI